MANLHCWYTPDKQKGPSGKEALGEKYLVYVGSILRLLPPKRVWLLANNKERNKRQNDQTGAVIHE
jgi:hypothetical protein